jgi:acetoin utilization deacetylase AcuC-like enzyme/GNAT superfamily N-acetyltransferase
MFSIRRILDSSAPANRAIIKQVQDILRTQFNKLKEHEINAVSKKLNDAMKYRFQSRLLVALRNNDSVLGFALIMHATDIGFCYLDFMAAEKTMTGQGLGGALYERVRDEVLSIGASCILMECLPDDPALSPEPHIRKQNTKRITFYESYGARVIIGTQYETPVGIEDTNPPYLVIDTLGKPLPNGKFMRKAVRAILERKYGDMCSPTYIEKVVKSFPINGISLRKPKNRKYEISYVLPSEQPRSIVLIANGNHDVHHVKERGYVESPVRINVILRELEKLSFIKIKPPKLWPEKHILSVHDSDYISFLKKACMSVPKGKSVYPYVFPIRNLDRKPVDTPLLAGYFCIDTFTPLNADAYKAARSAVDCVLTGAEEIVSGLGSRIAYALIRPPGHHAERRTFGGFCYFSNAAIAANYLSQYGKVAILDVDYHHGNGQQDIFYKRADVLTISLHGHPKFAYPYFTGFSDEMGEGTGYGYNLNIPMPEHLETREYMSHLDKALKRIREYNPDFLVVALGFDTAKADPTGTWELRATDFEKLGNTIGNINLPTLVVQEGGYRSQTLGVNARHFFSGLHKTTCSVKPRKIAARVKNSNDSIRIRRIVNISDIERIRDLVKKSGVFSTEEINIATELAAEAALKGEQKSGYSFVLIEESGEILGYSCFGRIPLTEDSFDLYWLVVDNERQKQGFAKLLLTLSESSIKSAKGQKLYAETSSQKSYEPARTFYQNIGFSQCALHKDFYKTGDDKITFVKFIK